MALTERAVEVYTILDDGQFQVRTTTAILRDGVPIAELNHREVLEPGADVTLRTRRLRDIAQVVWTPAVIAARIAARATASS